MLYIKRVCYDHLPGEIELDPLVYSLNRLTFAAVEIGEVARRTKMELGGIFAGVSIGVGARLGLGLGSVLGLG